MGYNVYEFGYRLGNEQDTEYIKKQIQNLSLSKLKGFHITWVIGYLEGILNRNDISQEDRIKVEKILDKVRK